MSESTDMSAEANTTTKGSNTASVDAAALNPVDGKAPAVSAATAVPADPAVSAATTAPVSEFLRVEGLCKDYGEGEAKVRVLKDIDVSLRQGEMCVLLGPSGSGKSTFLNIVGGLETADVGTIMCAGQELTALNDKQLGEYRRSELGFVFQFYNLVPDLTIKENIEVCAYLSKDALDIDQLLQDLGLWEHKDKFPRQVSGGQQQRCSIGRALVKNPGLILCDEPTGALDYQTSKEVLALIERVNKQYDCTVIIVTHNSAISQMAHRILRLRDGALVENTINTDVRPASELVW